MERKLPTPSQLRDKSGGQDPRFLYSTAPPLVFPGVSCGTPSVPTAGRLEDPVGETIRAYAGHAADKSVRATGGAQGSALAQQDITNTQFLRQVMGDTFLDVCFQYCLSREPELLPWTAVAPTCTDPAVAQQMNWTVGLPVATTSFSRVHSTWAQRPPAPKDLLALTPVFVALHAAQHQQMPCVATLDLLGRPIRPRDHPYVLNSVVHCGAMVHEQLTRSPNPYTALDPYLSARGPLLRYLWKNTVVNEAIQQYGLPLELRNEPRDPHYVTPDPAAARRFLEARSYTDLSFAEPGWDPFFLPSKWAHWIDLATEQHELSLLRALWFRWALNFETLLPRRDFFALTTYVNMDLKRATRLWDLVCPGPDTAFDDIVRARGRGGDDSLIAAQNLCSLGVTILVALRRCIGFHPDFTLDRIPTAALHGLIDLAARMAAFVPDRRVHSAEEAHRLYQSQFVDLCMGALPEAEYRKRYGVAVWADFVEELARARGAADEPLGPKELRLPRDVDPDAFDMRSMREELRREMGDRAGNSGASSSSDLEATTASGYMSSDSSASYDGSDDGSDDGSEDGYASDAGDRVGALAGAGAGAGYGTGDRGRGGAGARAMRG